MSTTDLYRRTAPFHFVDGVEAAMAKAQELAGDRTVEVAGAQAREHVRDHLRGLPRQGPDRRDHRLQLRALRMLQAILSRRCADVPGGSQANDTAVMLWDRHGRANQRFVIDNGRLRVYAGKCLDLRGSSPSTARRS